MLTEFKLNNWTTKYPSGSRDLDYWLRQYGSHRWRVVKDIAPDGGYLGQHVVEIDISTGPQWPLGTVKVVLWNR